MTENWKRVLFNSHARGKTIMTESWMRVLFTNFVVQELDEGFVQLSCAWSNEDESCTRVG